MRAKAIGPLLTAVLLSPSLALGRFAAPNLDLSITEADTIIVGTAVTPPACAGVVSLHHMDGADYIWTEVGLSPATNVLTKLKEMATAYKSADRLVEVGILSDMLERYYWVYETTVAVSNVLRGTTTTNSVVIRQMFPYLGYTIDSVMNQKLAVGTTYVLCLRKRYQREAIDVLELPFLFVAYPVAAEYEVWGDRGKSHLSHTELLQVLTHRKDERHGDLQQRPPPYPEPRQSTVQER